MTGTRELWHGEQALRLEADWGSVVLLPQRGAKIASLRDRTGHEWLAQPPPGALSAARAGQRYSDGEMCGWDEMAPTLHSPGLADHGEVWAVPWEVVTESTEQVTLEVRGSVVPFVLRRRTRLNATGLVLDYAVRSTSGRPDFLWVAHPQLRALKGTRLVLSSRRRSLVHSEDAQFELSWPAGEVDPFVGVERGAGRKVWCAPGTAPSAVTVHHPHGRSLTLSWTGAISDLAFWVDHCWRSREPVVAVEPATSFGDDLVRSAAAGTAVRLSETAWTRWSVGVHVVGPERMRDDAA